MFVFCLNKSGFRVILILQLLCLSLCPTYGRPSFDEDDTLPDESHDEEDEDQVDDEDESDSENEEDNDEENDSTPTPKTEGLKKCLGKTGEELKKCVAVEGFSTAVNVATGSSPQGLVAKEAGKQLGKFVPGFNKDEYEQ